MIFIVIILSVLILAALIGMFIAYYNVFFSPHPNSDEIEVKPFLDDMDIFNGIKEQAKKAVKSTVYPCSDNLVRRLKA